LIEVALQDFLTSAVSFFKDTDRPFLRRCRRKEEGLRIYIHSSNTRKSSVDTYSRWVANGLVCTWSNQPW